MESIQQSTIRESKYVEAPNCSVVQLCDGEVLLFGRPIYNTRSDNDNNINYVTGKALFVYKGDKHSLNQDPDCPRAEFKTVQVSLNIAFDIYQAFEEIDKENEFRIQRLYASG